MLDTSSVRYLRSYISPPFLFRPSVIDVLIAPRVAYSRYKKRPPTYIDTLVELVIVDLNLNRARLKGNYHISHFLPCFTLIF